MWFFLFIYFFMWTNRGCPCRPSIKLTIFIDNRFLRGQTSCITHRVEKALSKLAPSLYSVWHWLNSLDLPRVWRIYEHTYCIQQHYIATYDLITWWAHAANGFCGGCMWCWCRACWDIAHQYKNAYPIMLPWMISMGGRPMVAVFVFFFDDLNYCFDWYQEPDPKNHSNWMF